MSGAARPRKSMRQATDARFGEVEGYGTDGRRSFTCVCVESCGGERDVLFVPRTTNQRRVGHGRNAASWVLSDRSPPECAVLCGRTRLPGVSTSLTYKQRGVGRRGRAYRTPLRVCRSQSFPRFLLAANKAGPSLRGLRVVFTLAVLAAGTFGSVVLQNWAHDAV